MGKAQNNEIHVVEATGIKIQMTTLTQKSDSNDWKQRFFFATRDHKE